MSYKSRGNIQRIAQRIQMDRLESQAPIMVERGNVKRQEVLKHSPRVNGNGVIKISKKAREFHNLR